MIVREQFTVRPSQPSDYPAMAHLANAARRAVGDTRVVTVADLQREFESPGFDAAANTFVFETDGHMLAFVEIDFAPALGIIWRTAASTRTTGVRASARRCSG